MANTAHKITWFYVLDPAGTTARTLLNRLQLAEQQGKNVPWDKVIYLSFKKWRASCWYESPAQK